MTEMHINKGGHMYCEVCQKSFLRFAGMSPVASERCHAQAHASEDFPTLFIEYQNIGETIEKVIGDNMARCFQK